MITTVQTIPALRVGARPTMDSVHRQMERMLGELLPVARPVRLHPSTPAGVLDLAAADDRFLVSLEVPGLTAADIELTLEGDLLEIRGSRSVSGPAGASLLRGEIAERQLAHTVSIPGPVDADAVNATLVDGVLTVTLPKAPAIAKRTIEIATS